MHVWEWSGLELRFACSAKWSCQGCAVVGSVLGLAVDKVTCNLQCVLRKSPLNDNIHQCIKCAPEQLLTGAAILHTCGPGFYHCGTDVYNDPPCVLQELMPDGLHPHVLGMDLLADCLSVPIDKLMY